MTQQAARHGVPDWDIADRMRKSLRHSGMGVGEMALYLDVKRNTVSTWINGRVSPSKQTLMLWAARTGTTVAWLETGQGSPSGPPPSTEDDPDNEHSTELERAARRHRGRSLGAPAATRSYAA
jgi:transcriptional regulator with XRE-family HTH domain